MNDKAQVSFEYLVLITVLIIVGTVAMILANNYFTMTGAVKETGKIYKNNTLEMLSR